MKQSVEAALSGTDERSGKWTMRSRLEFDIVAVGDLFLKGRLNNVMTAVGYNVSTEF